MSGSERKRLEDDWDVEITLMVACYNEEEAICRTLDTLFAALDEVGCSHEVLVYDDGSRDRSVERVRAYMQQHPQRPLELVVNEVNRGLAQNYIEGAFRGRGRYYRLICGDDVEPKSTFVTVFRALGQADLIVPYQVECPGRPLHRRLLSKLFTGMVNGITGYRIKYYNGLAVHRRYDVMRWHTDYRGFGFQADMITRMLDQGVDYVEIPVTASERQEGESTALTLLNLLSVGHMFVDLSARRIGRTFFGRK
ncbi:MAG: glycosyltransferase family 2 protein [Planctomycetota bacterium]